MDTTYIAEYYHNGTGQEEETIRRYYKLIEDIPNQANADAAIAKARSIAKMGYVK